ncbi:hypothetical protein ACFL6U_23725 [Planctomycetota bacterium]
MRSSFKRITGFKNKLTRLSEQEPITKLALAVIILLDIFILSIIFGGLEDHTDQLTSPTEYFPHHCRQVFIRKDWTEANKIAKLQQLVLTDYNNYSYRHDSPFEKPKIAKMHPLCKEFYEKIRLIAENGTLKALFIERQQAAKKKDQLIKQYDKEHEVYDTKLLENIAGKDNGELSSMTNSMKAKGREIDRLNAQITDLNEKINGYVLVKHFWDLARPGDITRRENLIRDLNRFEKIYLFRELLWQLLFLLPLLAIFSVWHAKSIKKARNIQGLISAHLIVVASIPIVFKIVDVVLELIPYHFFKDLFELLERLHIIALWHYFVIILAIGVGLFFVFIIQKKIFSKERLYQKRLSKGGCYSCGKTLPEMKAAACPFCGTKQLRKCAGCDTETHFSGKFCTNCGQEQTA